MLVRWPSLPGRSTLRASVLLALAALCLLSIWPLDAQAQRPFRIVDPFYRDESARRAFYDRYAFTAEVSYRPAVLQNDPLQGGRRTPNADPLGVSFRLDYQLAQHFDVGLLIDAAGGVAGRNLSVSWVTLKYYRTVDVTDYAFRLAVDPASDGRSGFPQMDLAFLYRSLLTPTVSTDFALGVRRVRIGYQQTVYETPTIADPAGPPAAPSPDFYFIHSRALGLEFHAMMTYNIHFDIAGSNLFLTVLGQGGRYDLVDLGVLGGGAPPPDEEGRSTTAYRGGVVWALSGLEIDRPSYQFAPYLGVPLQQWAPQEAPPEGEWPRSRLHIGVRLMLR